MLWDNEPVARKAWEIYKDSVLFTAADLYPHLSFPKLDKRDAIRKIDYLLGLAVTKRILEIIPHAGKIYYRRGESRVDKAKLFTHRKIGAKSIRAEDEEQVS